MNFDWNDLAFGSKKPIRELRATFIAAPRELSADRCKQLVKQYLPKGNILFGISKEEYVVGLEGQPQFKMLSQAAIKALADKVNQAATTHKIYTFSYSQRDLVYILEKLAFQKVVLVNGSWYHAFHLRPEYYTLVNQHVPFEKISPFASEQEAKEYAATFSARIELPQENWLPASAQLDPNRRFTEDEMLRLANQAAVNSFDFGGHQTGVSLGRKTKDGYRLLATGFNRVVPYQTYAMHFGASREQYFSPMNDLNHYDTIHAEVDLLTWLVKNHVDISGTTLFINLLPCPTCARMFMQTDIAEFVYTQDHSDGYAVRLLEQANKTVRRIVP